MNYFIITLLILGIIQGTTEFLPISSSGHLVIFGSIPSFQNALKIQEGNIELFINVSLHIATLIAVIIYLWKDIISITRGLVSGIMCSDYKKSEIKIVVNVIVASIPAGVIGLLLHEYLVSLFSSYKFVFFMLIINGFILLSTKIVPIKNRKIEEIGLARSLLVGICQIFAILPGISRSGMTITMGIICGLMPGDAAKFSFFMAIPVIIGAGFLETIKAIEEGVSFNLILPVIIAMVVTIIVGLVSLKILFSLVRNVRIDIFGYYTLLIGIAGIIYIYFT